MTRVKSPCNVKARSKALRLHRQKFLNIDPFFISKEEKKILNLQRMETPQFKERVPSLLHSPKIEIGDKRRCDNSYYALLNTLPGRELFQGLGVAKEL